MTILYLLAAISIFLIISAWVVLGWPGAVLAFLFIAISYMMIMSD